MNTNNNNINNNNHDLDMVNLVMGLTSEEFFELVPQPPLSSSGYSLHFPSLEADHISSSDSEEEEEEEEEMESGNYYYNNVSYFENVGCCTTNPEPDDEDEDFALYEQKRRIRNEDIPMDISDSESDEDIPMDISDSESEDDEEEQEYKAVPLQRSVRCDGRPRPRQFQELEEGEIDESNLVYERQVAINSEGYYLDEDVSAWELDEALAQAELLVDQLVEDDELADLPDLIPIGVASVEEFNNANGSENANKRKISRIN